MSAQLPPTMPRPKSANDWQFSLFAPEEWRDEADELASQISATSSGIAVSRSDVLRLAIRRGLDVLKAEQSKRRR